MNTLRTEFNKRVGPLKLDFVEKDMLFDRFIRCWDAGFHCCYCNKRMDIKYENEYGWTIDHIISRKVGGKDTVGNLTFCCRDCNFQKKVMDAEEYRTKMEKIKLRKKKNESWKARKSTKKDEGTREAYKDIFKRVGANE